MLSDERRRELTDLVRAALEDFIIMEARLRVVEEKVVPLKEMRIEEYMERIAAYVVLQLEPKLR